MLRTVIVLLCALIPIAIGAQTDTTGRAPLPRCWRGKPLPLCRSFFLTEMAGEYAFATTKTTNGNDPFCALYAGPYTVGASGTGAGGSTGASRVKLVE